MNKNSGCEIVGGPSELDYRGKLNKTRASFYKKLQDVRNQFARIEKIKVETIKKTDGLENSVHNDLRRMEEEIMKSKDLVSESKERLNSEINTLRREIEEKYSEMRKRITETTTPT